MRDEIEGIWQAIQAHALPPTYQLLFRSGFDEESQAFSAQETYIIDYKDRCPRNFSKEFGASIVRLSLAFYNTFGGIIAFGVDDETKQPSGLDCDLDIEALNAAITAFSGAKFEILTQSYMIPTGEGYSKITAALIPRRGTVPPAKTIAKLDKYPIGSLWVRQRHEVLACGPEQMALLFSNREQYPAETDDASVSIQRSLPPKPATVKQFVGREDILADLWSWLVFADQPRIYLHGPGGSGKSAIAFEFAESLANAGKEIKFPNGDALDYVIYLSGKETELDTFTGRERPFKLRQFSSEAEIFTEILLDTGFRDSSDLLDAGEDEVESVIDELFDTYSGLIVLDDIDALSRRGVDTGEESLFIKILNGAKRTRVLYTLRQSPTHAKRSSVHVPGLNYGEFLEFVEVACEQFGVTQPSPQIVPRVQEETNSLPLLIENIIGLRKFCGSYEEAIRQHRERGGDDARRYLYQREYDQLTGRSREVLAALALMQEPVRFSTLADMLDFSSQVVIDALNECASIFLIMQEDASGETVYQLAPVARPFISGISKNLTYFEQIARKVELFRREDATPEESAIILRFERLIRTGAYGELVELADAIAPEDVARANPKIRALMGVAYGNLEPPQRIKAIECFQYAESMRYFEIGMMRAWYHAERTSGHGLANALDICEKVLKRPNIAPKFKAEFHNKLAMAQLQEGKSLEHVSREKAIPYFDGAFKNFLENLYLAQVHSLSPGQSLYRFSSTCRDYIRASRGDLNAFFKTIEDLPKAKHDVAVEGAQVLISSFVGNPFLPFSSQGVDRFAGLLKRCRTRLSGQLKDEDRFPGFRMIIDAFERFEDRIAAG